MGYELDWEAEPAYVATDWKKILYQSWRILLTIP
jgi:hypothetical protein